MEDKMAENDIYNSELRYRSFIENLQKLTIPAKDRKLVNRTCAKSTTKKCFGTSDSVRT